MPRFDPEISPLEPYFCDWSAHGSGARRSEERAGVAKEEQNRLTNATPEPTRLLVGRDHPRKWMLKADSSQFSLLRNCLSPPPLPSKIRKSCDFYQILGIYRNVSLPQVGHDKRLSLGSAHWKNLPLGLQYWRLPIRSPPIWHCATRSLSRVSTPFLPIFERSFNPTCAPTVKSNLLAITPCEQLRTLPDRRSRGPHRRSQNRKPKLRRARCASAYLALSNLLSSVSSSSVFPNDQSTNAPL